MAVFANYLRAHNVTPTDVFRTSLPKLDSGEYKFCMAQTEGDSVCVVVVVCVQGGRVARRCQHLTGCVVMHASAGPARDVLSHRASRSGGHQRRTSAVDHTCLP